MNVLINPPVARDRYIDTWYTQDVRTTRVTSGPYPSLPQAVEALAVGERVLNVPAV